MATQNPKLLPGLKAAGDLSAKQYLFMKLSADHTVTTCTATTDKAIGVLQNDPSTAGEDAAVADEGTTKVVAGAAIAVGALVAPTATGKAQTAVATQYARGMALEPADAVGDIIEIKLMPMTVMA